MNIKIYKNKLLNYLFITICTFAITLSLISTSTFNTNISAETNSTTTISPSAIDLSQSEIINPNRGYYKWRSGREFYAGEVVPMNGTHVGNSNDIYERFTWDELESDTTPGDYSKGFALFDSYAAEAQRTGGKFSFRIYALCPLCYSEDNNKVWIPQYAVSGSNGWYLNGHFVPDWNNTYFLSRVQALMTAFGNRYNNDQRIGVIDIGIYGKWGEWHMSEGDYPRIEGQVDITEANKRKLIDMHLNAFSNKQLVALIDKYSLIYTKDKATNAGKVGWRGDCLGLLSSDLFDLPKNSTTRVNDGYEHFRRISEDTVRRQDGYMSWKEMWDSWLKDRWKEAIITTEFCPLYFNKFTPGGLNDVDAAYQQVLDYHVSLVGNGNITPPEGDNPVKWNSFSAGQKDKLIQLGKVAGYRYSIANVTIPTSISQGVAFSVSTNWKNTGVAPIYEKWDAYYQLVDPVTKAVKWESKSITNLKTILPTGNTTSAVADNFTVPATVAAGNYELRIKVKDTTTNYRKPLQLAMSGKQTDGSYLLGNIQLITSTTTPTVTPTTICTRKPEGDAICDGNILLSDFNEFLKEFRNYNIKPTWTPTTNADFNNDAKVTLADFNIWRATFVSEQQ